ncbi:MAG: tetratricopeptide repeat protein [Candidatus Sulfotelmatobacter sp.]
MKSKARSRSYNRALVVMLFFTLSSPVFAVNRSVIEDQVRVRTMSDEALVMQQSMDQTFASATQSLRQSSEQLAALQKELARIQETVQARSANTRWAALAGQVTALTQSASTLNVGLQKLEHQAQVLGSEIGTPAQAVAAAGQAPPPDVLLRNGMEDYDAGRYKLASQEFAQYMKFYSARDQAAQAQFYLADSEYWAGDSQSALGDFDVLEQQFPATEPATVELKEGLCLVKLGELGAAKAAFHRIIDRYPNSVEAMEARSALGPSPAWGVS